MSYKTTPFIIVLVYVTGRMIVVFEINSAGISIVNKEE